MIGIAFRRPGHFLQELLPLLGALTLMGLVACGSASSPPVSSPTASSPSSTESLQSDDLGPLTVIDATGGSLALGGTGPVRIEENCVTMALANGDILLLIWHANEVRWDADSREITYSSAAHPDAQPITIHDGDTITVGGESLLSDEPVTRAPLPWLATPHPSCSGEPWAVSGLTKP